MAAAGRSINAAAPSKAERRAINQPQTIAPLCLNSASSGITLDRFEQQIQLRHVVIVCRTAVNQLRCTAGPLRFDAAKAISQGRDPATALADRLCSIEAQWASGSPELLEGGAANNDDMSQLDLLLKSIQSDAA